MPLICPTDKTENSDASLFCSRCNGKLTRLGPGVSFVEQNVVIDSVLREDAFSFSFLAEDPKKGTRYLVREFFPPNPTSRHLKRRFTNTARALQTSPIASMRILYPFTHDNRWYTVAESFEGLSLRSELQQAGLMDEEAVQKTFRAIVKVLREIHDASLYHGNLTSDRVMLQSDGSLCLVDSIFVGEMLREAGPTSPTAMVQKDLRAAGFLALEMLDGRGATEDPTERLAHVEDLALGATLGYVFCRGRVKPSSAHDIQQLDELVMRAASAPDPEAPSLCARVYDQYGLKQFEPGADGRKTAGSATDPASNSSRLDVPGASPAPGVSLDQQTATTTQVASAPRTLAVPRPDQERAARSPDVDEGSVAGSRARSWWKEIPILFAAICMIAAVLVAVYGWPWVPQTLHVGLYNWPSFAPYYAAQIAGLTVEIEDTVPSLLARDGKGRFHYDVISMPITAIRSYQEDLLRQGWHLVWALDRSKGAEHLLINLNRAKGASQIDDARMNSGPMASIRGTFAAHLLESYLGSHYKELRTQGQIDEPETGRELLSGASKDTIIVVHDPFAAYLQRTGLFHDVPMPVAHADYVNVLLVAPHVLSDDKLSNCLIAFIAALPEGRTQAVEHSSDSDLDLRSVRRLRFFAGPDLEKREVTQMLAESELIDTRQNRQFLYDFGDFACTTVVGHLLDPADTINGPCRLVDEKITDHLWRRLVVASGFRSVPVNASDLVSLCTSHRHLEAVKPSDVIGGFNPSGSAALTAEMEGAIAKVTLDVTSYYCVIGYGDADGGDARNVTVGQERAEAVARQLNTARGIAFERMVRVSLGRTESKKGKEYRRVEIKRIALQLGGGH